MEFKFEYNKKFTDEDYLNNIDIFRTMIHYGMISDAKFNNMDALMKSGVVDNFSVDEDGLVCINFNDEKIKNLVEEWRN